MVISLPDADTMYSALVNRDSNFEGIFFAGIVTTGIFCRPTCTARKPQKKNVEFFSTTREALLNGYRPCKICRPMESPGLAPEWLKPVFKELTTHPDVKIKDWKLQTMNIDPNRVRRWFKKNHQMTFQAYQRYLKIGMAFGQIKQGDKVIAAAFDSGYESLSGFSDSFQKFTGFSPGKSPERILIKISRISTPLGPMVTGATDKGICLLEFADRPMLETQVKRISRIFQAKLIPGISHYFDILSVELNEYFAGKRQIFSIPLDLKGTPFQERVWQLLKKIPFGTTRSYKTQADLIGKPEAIRAVARANGDNRISILIPCHRVIGSNGQLTGYGGGIWRKKYMLDLERQYLNFTK